MGLIRNVEYMFVCDFPLHEGVCDSTIDYDTVFKLADGEPLSAKLSNRIAQVCGWRYGKNTGWYCTKHPEFKEH